jgi:hypothetical protein
MKSPSAPWMAAVFVLVLLVTSRADDLRLDANALVTLATVEQGRHVLTNRDEFIAALSPFDRAVRMKNDRPVAEREFLDFLGRSVVGWTPEETHRIGAAVKALGDRCSSWHLPLPAEILLIKTSGEEEGHACYTRQQAIILPHREAGSAAADLEPILSHELFHVLSRCNPKLRDALYRIVGFSPINEVELPPGLAPRRLSNPDGFQNRWAITITNRGVALPVVPILFSSTDHYDASKGGELFAYLKFRLLGVERRQDHWQPRVLSGEPQLLEVPNISGFYEQVGRNTDYIIHPDEILAVNFVKLIQGETNVPTPRILSEMRRVLKSLPPARVQPQVR